MVCTHKTHEFYLGALAELYVQCISINKELQRAILVVDFRTFYALPSNQVACLLLCWANLDEDQRT